MVVWDACDDTAWENGETNLSARYEAQYAFNCALSNSLMLEEQLRPYLEWDNILGSMCSQINHAVGIFLLDKVENTIWEPCDKIVAIVSQSY